MDNRIESGHTLREILDIVDDLSFQSKDDLFELSKIYEDLLQGMGNDGGNSGEFYTPRPVIRAMEDFNLHTIVSLPAGIFLPYSGVKTNVIFFDKTHATKEIWYYEVDPDRKLTKNKPITYEELTPWVDAYKKRPTNEQAWTVKIEDIQEFDISAKNPAKIKEIIHRDPLEILADIQATDEKILVERKKLEEMLG